MGACYDTIGKGYRRTRRPDPRIERRVHAVLADVETVVNVGAGCGSYEPAGRFVVAVEPSAVMIAQRPPTAAPVVRAVAEALPFPDDTFDAALAILTLHHWDDATAGLAELRRVARRQLVLLNEPAIGALFWLLDYFPEVRALPSEIDPPGVARIAEHLAVRRVEPVPIPSDCRDGFLCAYWNRPDAYLSQDIRSGISALAQLDPEVADRGLRELHADLLSGRWDDRHGHLRDRREYDWGYRLVVAGE